jgi:hypothetical protein
MADTAVAIKDASGATVNVDAFSQAGGDVRQAGVIGDAAAAYTAGVNSLGALQVNLAGSAGLAAAVSGTLTGNASAVSAACINSGSATIVISGGTYTALPIVFEASRDGGTTYFPIDATFVDGSGSAVAMVLPSAATRAWNLYLLGYTHVRVRQTAAATAQTGNPTVTIDQSPFAADPSPVIAPVDGQKATYCVYINGLASNFAGDFFWITGSATKILRLIRLEVGLTMGGTAVTAGGNVLALVKRSTLDTAGTAGTVPVIGANDTIDPVATATTGTYSFAPTNGVLANTIRAWRFLMGLNTLSFTWDFGNRPSRAPVLRGTSQQLALNLAAAVAGTAPTNAWTILAEFTEE